jgi:hypothetical protein
MHRLFRDALNTALQKLGFPWLTPHPTKTSPRNRLLPEKHHAKRSLRNVQTQPDGAQYSIVFDVADDALAAGFNVTDLDGSRLNANEILSFSRSIQKKLLKF